MLLVIRRGRAQLFLANHLRQLVKAVLTGDPAIDDKTFIKRARDVLGERESPTYEAEKQRLVELERNQIAELRAEGYVCLTATGLVILGKVAYELFTKQRLYPDWRAYARRLGAEIDWRKSAAIWQDNIVMGGKILTNRAPVNRAVDAVKKQLGMLSLDTAVAETEAA